MPQRYTERLSSPVNVKPAISVCSFSTISMKSRYSRLQHTTHKPKVCAFIQITVIDSDWLCKQSHYHSKRSARRTLSHARAVRNTLQAEEDLATKYISEMEEYLQLLRENRADIQHQVAEASELHG
jgi:hypothetical protein